LTLLLQSISYDQPSVLLNLLDSYIAVNFFCLSYTSYEFNMLLVRIEFGWGD